VAVCLVLVASLFLRLMDLDALIVSDEMRWTCRSLGFRDAVLQGDWSSTFRVGHPGVVTTWLGALFMPRAELRSVVQARETCQVTDDAKRLYLAGETSREVGQRLAEVGEILFRMRVGVALFTWLCIAAIYLLVRSRWGSEVAVAGLLLVALGPFYLAHSRFLHLDAVLTSLMTLSVLSLLIAVQRRGSVRSGRLWKADPYLLLSGVTGGLAALQKSPAMFLAPFAAVVLLIDVVRRGWGRDVLGRGVRDLVIWGVAAGVVYVALWPTMWVDPVGTVRKVLGTAVGYAEEGHTLGNYFMGRPVLDPGWAFYPLAILFRLSPLALVGLLASGVWLAKGEGRSEDRCGLVLLLLYAGLFGVFMSSGAKKFDRYILPVFPVLEVGAAFGLLWLLDIARDRLKGGALWVAFGGYLLAMFLQLGLAFPHRPHYLTYYNPVLGGVRRAKDVLLLGWNEGYDEAVPYLNAKANAEDLQVAVGRFSGFAPLFRGEARTMYTYSVWETDYVIIYVSQLQRQRNEDMLAEYFYNSEVQPERVFNLHGVDYLWIYPNRHYVEPVKCLEEHGRPAEEDCLLVNADSLLVKHYEGGLPTYGFRGQWNPAEEAHTYWGTEELAGLLDDMSVECRRVWYARYPEYEPDAYVDLLEGRGLLLGREPYPHMELLLYELVAPKTGQVLDLRFGNLRLSGYGVTDPPPAWGRDGGVFLAWEALEPVELDYTVFLHLYDAHDQRIAQGDALLVDQALRPTSRWEPGSSRTTLYDLSIPPGTPPGQYELAVGVYRRDTGDRLPLLNGDGGGQEKSVRLSVEVGVPDRAPEPASLGLPHLLEQDVIASRLRLLGYDLGHEAILAGYPVPVRLVWEALSPLEQDYQLRLQLRDRTGVPYAQGEFQLVSTDYPASHWQPGELLQEWYDLPTDENLVTGEMELALNLVGDDGQPVLTRPVTVTDVWVQSRQPSFHMPQISTPRAVNLGDRVTFLGYDLAPLVLAGEDLPVTLYWQAQREMEEDYKVFLHMYDSDGSIVAQQDRIPGLGARPTTTWEREEIVADRFLVPIDPATPAGAYRLAIGLYDGQTGKRLAAFGPDGQRLEGDRILLDRVEVVLW
jgi:hypothetical protein